MTFRRLFEWEIQLWRRIFPRRTGLAAIIKVAGSLIRGILGDRIWVRAGYMTYLSLLHMVPLGALGLALSSRLGGEARLIQWLEARLAPTAPDLAAGLVAAMEGLDLTALGYLGLIGIVIAGLFALLQLEHDMDDIFVVRSHRPVWKSIFLIYPFMFIVAPLLVAVALASAALIEAQSRILIAQLGLLGPLGQWFRGLVADLPGIFHLIPYGVTWLLLTAIYYLIPSGPVRLRAALLGGVVAGVIWQVVQGFYLHFQFASATFREAWGYLAQIPLLLIWVFVSWFIVFLGAELTFVWQYRRAFMPKWPEHAVPVAAMETALVDILRKVMEMREDYPKGMTPLKLSTVLQIPWRLVVRLCDDLAEIGALERQHYHRHVRYRYSSSGPELDSEGILDIWRQHGTPQVPQRVRLPVAEPSESPGKPDYPESSASG